MRRPPRTCGSDRPLRLPRGLDVSRDLLDERGLALERLLVPQPRPELDRQLLSVQVALEVEQERLDAALLAAVVRIRADGDRRTTLPSRARVDAEAGHDDARLRADVGGREPERAAARVAGDHDARHLRRAAEQQRRALDLAVAEQV